MVDGRHFESSGPASGLLLVGRLHTLRVQSSATVAKMSRVGWISMPLSRRLWAKSLSSGSRLSCERTVTVPLENPAMTLPFRSAMPTTGPNSPPSTAAFFTRPSGVWLHRQSPPDSSPVATTSEASRPRDESMHDLSAVTAPPPPAACLPVLLAIPEGTSSEKSSSSPCEVPATMTAPASGLLCTPAAQLARHCAGPSCARPTCS
mmetsp:Transcript_43009/g.102098  ORF Transcript_43009/g.102098 Transcript_43009/m.102098 type:complete len:205 (-) Transcript_43009:442-1056(-)